MPKSALVWSKPMPSHAANSSTTSSYKQIFYALSVANVLFMQVSGYLHSFRSPPDVGTASHISNSDTFLHFVEHFAPAVEDVVTGRLDAYR